MRWAVIVSLLVACAAPKISSTGTRASVGETPYPVRGSWTWTQSHVHPGHIRIEREDWQLHTEINGSISGWLIRENRFLSTDGEPFACMQALSYSRRARYKLRGTRTAAGLSLEETQVVASPSPCEDGLRPLQKYSGQMEANGRLRLQWPGGEQVLQPVSSNDAKTSSRALSLTGIWSWTAHGLENSLERTESEYWQFEELPDHAVVARYRREVLVVDRSGSLIACAGSDRYTYEDNYELRGTLNKSTLHLQEVSVKAANHACIDSQRILDAADITIYPESMVLEWRGRRLQVLKPTRPNRRIGL